MTISMHEASRLSPAGDDAVRPFAVEALDVRGRAIQMGPTLDAILARHDYPPAVSKLLGEAVVLAVLLEDLLGCPLGNVAAGKIALAPPLGRVGQELHHQPAGPPSVTESTVLALMHLGDG